MDMKLINILYERRKAIDAPPIGKLILQNKALYLAMEKNYLPITPKISKVIYGDVRAKAFHMVEPKNLPHLINIQGQKKAISSSTKITGLKAQALCGPVRCGAGVYLEGTVMFNSWRDLASAPDQSGRRWIALEKLDTDFNSKYWFNTAYSDELSDIRDAIDDLAYKGSLYIDRRKKLEALYIKRYIELSEEFILDPKRVKEIKAISLKGDASKLVHANNEIILNQIEVIDVIINEKYVDKGLKPIIPKIKSNIKGKLIISPEDDLSGRVEFFSNRKATIL